MTGLYCVRCGETAARHYVRLDTAGHVCTACLVEEIHDLRERVAELEDERHAVAEMKRAAH